ncbi:hypothetical protein [Microcoleus asticus]|uniref:hypothetical protein n=1 Tax=Microcoleus asticus TaxID=2815231 RepID=UPI00155449E5|nr:hypothetical protein [Microcoleus asticus]
MTKYLHGCDGDHAGDATGEGGEGGVGECPGGGVGECPSGGVSQWEHFSSSLELMAND